MVSLQPINISYIEETQSCFLQPVKKTYKKGGLMNTIVVNSPIFAHIIQVANMDEWLDSGMFDGTCFAPCKEYSDKYFRQIKENLDNGLARRIVQDSLLENRFDQKLLFDCNLKIPTLNKTTFTNLEIDVSNRTINKKYIIVKGDLQCTNGILHLINGIIDTMYV